MINDRLIIETDFQVKLILTPIWPWIRFPSHVTSRDGRLGSQKFSNLWKDEQLGSDENEGWKNLKSPSTLFLF